MNTIQNFLRRDEGDTALEYGLITARLAVLILTVVKTIGKKLNTDFGKISAVL